MLLLGKVVSHIGTLGFCTFHFGTLEIYTILSHSCKILSHSGTLVLCKILSHSGTLVQGKVVSHSGMLRLYKLLSHSGTLVLYM